MKQENLDEFRCCLSEDQHFLIKPLTLPICGHSVCKECLPKDEQKIIKCKKCDVVSHFDFTISQVNLSTKVVKIELTSLYENMFEILEKETSSKINHLKSISENHNDLLDLKVKYIEDEIDIRIESIKDQLELARENLRNELSKIKTEIKKSFEETQKDEKVLKHDLLLKNLQNNIQTKMNINEQWLDEYQKNFKDLNQLINNQNFNISKVLDFHVSKETVSELIIGSILFKNESIVDLKEFLSDGKPEMIELNHDVWDLTALDINRVVCSSINSSCLTVYDGTLNLLRKVEIINGESFSPRGLACNDCHVFIADQKNHRVIMTDFDFNKIESIGSRGNAYNQFNTIMGICYNNKHLYVCDNLNKRIQIYSKDLEFVKTLKVEYNPWLVKTSNLLLVVQPGNIKPIFIYEISSLNLKLKIDNIAEYCRLSVINSNIYRFNSRTKSVLFYDENGNFKEEMTINNIDSEVFSSCLDGTFIDFNGCLLITSYSAQKLIKFSRN